MRRTGACGSCFPSVGDAGMCGGGQANEAAAVSSAHREDESDNTEMVMKSLCQALSLAMLPMMLAAQTGEHPSPELPAAAVASLTASLEAAGHFQRQVWRDTTATNEDGTVNAYIEIPRGDLRKWEFNMQRNARAIDRVMTSDVGGYPVNYGFVPQTISYDGDPFDALVLGPTLTGGRVASGAIVGLLLMEDENGIDAKVVLSPVNAQGKPRYQLNNSTKNRIAAFFRVYKQHETGKFSKVSGWGSAADGQAHVEMTGAFFRDCRAKPDEPCRVAK